MRKKAILAFAMALLLLFSGVPDLSFVLKVMSQGGDSILFMSPDRVVIPDRSEE